MVGGKLVMKWWGSEFKQTTTASARNSARLSSSPHASKILSLIPGRKSCWKPPMDSAARRIARWIRSGSNFTNARLRFWTLTMRFWTAMTGLYRENPKPQTSNPKQPKQIANSASSRRRLPFSNRVWTRETRHPKLLKHGHQHSDRSNPASLQEYG